MRRGRILCRGQGGGDVESWGLVSSLGLSTPLAELQASEGLSFRWVTAIPTSESGNQDKMAQCMIDA